MQGETRQGGGAVMGVVAARERVTWLCEYKIITKPNIGRKGLGWSLEFR